MTTKEDVKPAFHIWKFSQEDTSCFCASHDPDNHNVCKREAAWRSYCKLRDEYLGDPRHGIKKPDLRDILDLFDSMNT